MNEAMEQATLRDGDPKKAEQSTLDQLLVTMRIIASAGAVVIIGLGVILGFQLFSMLNALVQEPTPIVTSWQQVMENGRVAAQPATRELETEASDSLADTTSVVSDPSTSESLPTTSTTAEDDHGHRRMNVLPEDTPSFIVLADHIMERLETGAYSWLLGVGVLMVFCWFLIKIPGMFITAGTRLLLGLLNVSTEK